MSVAVQMPPADVVERADDAALDQGENAATRLIGHTGEVRQHPRVVEARYRNALVEQLARLRGRTHRIDYRRRERLAGFVPRSSSAEQRSVFGERRLLRRVLVPLQHADGARLHGRRLGLRTGPWSRRQADA